MIYRIVCLSLVIIAVLVFQGCSHLNTNYNDPKLLLNKATSAYEKGNFNRSKQYIEKGLALTNYQAKTSQISLIALLAKIRRATGDYTESTRHAQRCIELTSDHSNVALNIQCRLIVSSNLRSQGRTSTALYIVDDLNLHTIFETDESLHSEYLLVTGALKQEQKQLEPALSDYEHAYKLAQNQADARRQARALNNIGGIYQLTSRYSEAENAYTQALTLRKSLKDKAGLSSTYGNICNLNIQLRNYTTAKRQCEHAYRLAKRIGAVARQSNILNSLAAIYRYQGNYDKALDTYSASAELSAQLDNQDGLAHTLSNLGELHFQIEQYISAIAYYKRALQITQDLNDMYEQAIILNNIGLAYEKTGDYQQALAAYHESLILHSQFKNLEDQWRVMANLSNIHGQLTQPRLAVFYGKQAISRLQHIRENLKTFSSQQQSHYLHNKRYVYENLANHLIDLGRLYEAQQVLSLLKKDEYLDYMRSRSGNDELVVDPVYTVHEQRYIDLYTELSADLVALHTEYQPLNDKAIKQQLTLTAAEEKRYQELDSALDLARYAFDDYLDELSNVLSLDTYDDTDKISESGLKTLKGLKTTVHKIEPNTAFIHFLITKERLRIIITFSDPSLPPVQRDVNISRENLNHRINKLKVLLQTYHSDPKPAAKALYEVTIAPILKDLEDNKTTLLLLHLDEALRYIPFAAIHDGKDYLINRFQMAIYTSQADSKIESIPKKPWRVAGLGVSHAVHEEFSPLVSVERELHDIIQVENQKSDRGIHPGEIYLNQSFTKRQLEKLLQRDNNPFRVMHIASHYNHAPGSPADSFLLTGTGTPLTLQSIKNDLIYMSNLDLFTLSACETAVYADNANGKEIDSLANTLLDNGVKSVIATLWRVNDDSTAAFMQAFYQLRKSDNLSKAAALRAVQQQFLTHAQDVDHDSTRGAIPLNLDTHYKHLSGYSHPFYWAPFILMGNFR